MIYVLIRYFTLSILLLSATSVYSYELIDYRQHQTNAIGERTLKFKIIENKREIFNLEIPVTYIDESAWTQNGKLNFHWDYCRTDEMLSGNGSLNQCIRRAFLAIHGEGDILHPAQVRLQILKNGSLAVSYEPIAPFQAHTLSFVAKPMKLSTHWLELIKGLNKNNLPTKVDLPKLPGVGQLDQDPKVEFLFFGDTGTGKSHQYEVANGIKDFCNTTACDFAVLLGDNFYGDGVSGPQDPQFQSKFEKPYAKLEFRFRPTLGNHDHDGNIRGQIEYSTYSEKWDMPGRYYHYAHGDVAFFAIDTDDFDLTQRRWLADALSQSTQKWKIVYGHHPVYSYGAHGNTWHLIAGLLPLLKKHKVDFYLSGHDHDKQVIERDGLVFLVSGAGAKTRSVKQGRYSKFASSTYGFAHLSIEEDQAHVRYLDKDGEIQFEKTYTK